MDPKTWKEQYKPVRNMRCDIPSHCKQLYVFWMTPPQTPQVRTYLMAPLSTKKHIKTFEHRIHWNINIPKNKFVYEKKNGLLGWNKHSEEHH